MASNDKAGVRPRPPRTDVNMAATLTASDGHTINVIIRDLSADGFRIELDDELLVGELVTIRVGKRGPYRAAIRWALGREAGGRFVDAIDPEDGPRDGE